VITFQNWELEVLLEAKTEFCFFAKFCIVVIFVFGGKKKFLYKSFILKFVKEKAILGQVCHILFFGCNR
jgi:hypothetical protein